MLKPQKVNQINHKECHIHNRIFKTSRDLVKTEYVSFIFFLLGNPPLILAKNMNPQQPNGMPGQNQIQGQNGMPQNMGNMEIRPNSIAPNQPQQGGQGGPSQMNQPQTRPPMNQNFAQNYMGGMPNNRFPPNNHPINVRNRLKLFCNYF